MQHALAYAQRHRLLASLSCKDCVSKTRQWCTSLPFLKHCTPCGLITNLEVPHKTNPEYKELDKIGIRKQDNRE